MGGKGLFVSVFSFFSVIVDCAANDNAHRLNHPQRKNGSSPPLKLHVSDHHVMIDNGIVKLTLTNPTGLISGVSYGGVKNVLEYRNKETQRGYWDIVGSKPNNGNGSFDTLHSTSFRIIKHSKDEIEVSFTITWNTSLSENGFPLNIDKRFIMLRGVSGFYSYAIFEHQEGWPPLNIDEARIAFKLHQGMFNYMAISDDKQRFMPTENDRGGGHTLAYNEAVRLTNPSNSQFRGEVDDKYQYTCENKDEHVHGWISSRPHIGFWVITPSDEFLAGGPLKQDLTSHAGPTSLAVFFSNHYAGPDFGVKLRDGEPWKKVFGPVFIYLNSDSENKPSTLWKDAKKQMSTETKKWPYDFVSSSDYPHANQRGTIRGRLLVNDRHANNTDPLPAKRAYVGLAPSGDVGSWQDDAKGYQFWTRTDEDGYFSIKHVRPDTYDLYAWVPGFIGDFRHDKNVIIRPGKHVKIGDLVYDPPRNGPTLWEIGIADRKASEFYIPDPACGLMNKLYINHTEKFRQYGLWDKYSDLYPTNDLKYIVGVSDYGKDWFFAHVNRKIDKHKYIPTTWQISFEVKNIISTGSYTLRLAVASATMAEIQIRINDPDINPPHFTTRRIGRDNAIARHGIHGRYLLYSVDVRGSQLLNGKNTIYLKQARGSIPFFGVMYDYIRMEGPVLENISKSSSPNHKLIKRA